MNTRVWILLIAAAGIAVLIWFLADMFPGSLDSDVDQANLVRAFGLMVLIGAGLVLSPKLNLKGAFKAGFIWVMIGLVLVVGYTLKDDFAAIGSRLMGALVPSMAVETGAGEITLNRRSDGHFHVSATVNGERVQFLVDTGASVVTLTRDDAMCILNAPLPYQLSYSGNDVISEVVTKWHPTSTECPSISTVDQ